jgi:hypothetical protein
MASKIGGIPVDKRFSGVTGIMVKVKVKVTLKQYAKTQRGRGIALSLALALHGSEWSMPHPGCFTHCTGGWVGLRAGLDRCGKSCPQPAFNPRTVQRIASHIPTELSQPTVGLFVDISAIQT